MFIKIYAYSKKRINAVGGYNAFVYKMPLRICCAVPPAKKLLATSVADNTLQNAKMMDSGKYSKSECGIGALTCSLLACSLCSSSSLVFSVSYLIYEAVVKRVAMEHEGCVIRLGQGHSQILRLARHILNVSVVTLTKLLG